MATLKRPAVLLIILLLVVIGVGVLPGFVRTADALGAWDILVAGLFIAFFTVSMTWLHSAWIRDPPGFARWGWVICVAFSLAALGAYARRPSLAEVALHELGVFPQKRVYSGLHAWLLKKLGIQIEFRDAWSTDLHFPAKGIAGQHDLDRSMALLAIFQPKHLTLTCSKGVYSLEPLNRLRSLNRLIIHVKSSADCSTLGDLTELISLNVGGAYSALDLRSLGRAPKLEYLAVAGVSWEDAGSFLPRSQSLTALSVEKSPRFARFTGSPMPNLSRLSLSFTSPQLDLTGLPDFAPALKSLTFGQCDQRVDFQPLQRLSKLESLSFNSPRRSVLPFPQLNALVHASFRQCDLSSLSALAESAPNLESIYIEKQSVTLSYEGMERFPKLRRLAVFDCLVDQRPEHVQMGKRLEYFVTPRPSPKSSGGGKPCP